MTVWPAPDPASMKPVIPSNQSVGRMIRMGACLAPEERKAVIRHLTD